MDRNNAIHIAFKPEDDTSGLPEMFAGKEIGDKVTVSVTFQVDTLTEDGVGGLIDDAKKCSCKKPKKAEEELAESDSPGVISGGFVPEDES